MLSPYALERVEGFRATAAGKRPKLSLASLIGQAILSSTEQKARLSTIYEWIAQRYPEYYQMNQGGWQNSIRHNLTINKAFVRLPKAHGDQPGKGAFWTIHPDHLDEFKDGVFVGKIRGAEYRAMPKSKNNRRSSYSGPVKRHPDYFPDSDYEYGLSSMHAGDLVAGKDLCHGPNTADPSAMVMGSQDESDGYGFSGPPPMNTRVLYGSGGVANSPFNPFAPQPGHFLGTPSMMFNFPFMPPPGTISSSGTVHASHHSHSQLHLHPNTSPVAYHSSSSQAVSTLGQTSLAGAGPMWQTGLGPGNTGAADGASGSGPLPQLLRSHSQYSFGYSAITSAPDSPPQDSLAVHADSTGASVSGVTASGCVGLEAGSEADVSHPFHPFYPAGLHGPVDPGLDMPRGFEDDFGSVKLAMGSKGSTPVHLHLVEDVLGDGAVHH